MVTTEDGEIIPGSETGFFAGDTRFISSYRIGINGQPWQLATSFSHDYYCARYHSVYLPLRTACGDLAKHALGLVLDRRLGNAVMRTSASLTTRMKMRAFIWNWNLAAILQTSLM